MKAHLILLLCLSSVPSRLFAELAAEMKVHPTKLLHPIDRRIYGQFIEHFGRIVQGGLWAELLRNRKFYPDDPNRNQVAEPWQPERDRSHVSYVIDRSITLNGISSQRVSLFGGDGSWRGIRQGALHVLGGRTYAAEAWIKAEPVSGSVSFRLESSGGVVAAHAEADLQAGDWRKYEFRLTPDQDLDPAVFRIAFSRSGANWIGAASLMPADNVDGSRRDVIELIRAMGPTILRWPGGGYTDSYDWRKAIGPRDRRPPQDLLPFGQPYGYDNGTDPNDFGTDEFLRVCERLGAEPYISANFGSGTPEMAAAWVEYTNGSPGTTWGAKRVANGHRAPYGVKNWSIGNEIWGPFETGYTNSEGYAAWFIPIARAMKSVDPSIHITAVGHFDEPNRKEWNELLLQRAWQDFDRLSLHHYYPGSFHPPTFQNRPLEFYLAVVAEPSQVERGVREMIAMADRISAGHKQIQMALDEWNEWDWPYTKPLETPRRSAINQFVDLVNKSGLEFNHTERDAIFGARILQMLMRLSDRVPIAIRTHMINSLGAIRTDSTRAFITASGKTMELYGNHTGTLLVDSEQTAPAFDVPEDSWTGIPYLDSVATLSKDRKRLFLHLINLHPTESLILRTRITSGKLKPGATEWRIAPEDFLSRNEFGLSNVEIRRRTIMGVANDFSHNLAPHSMTILELGLAGQGTE